MTRRSAKCLVVDAEGRVLLFRGVSEVGPALFERRVRMTWAGRSFDHFERYFLVRVGSVDVQTDRWTDEDRDVITAHHWWTIDELRSADEVVFPENLADRLERVLGG